MSTVSDYIGLNLTTITATIQAGQSESAPIDLSGSTLKTIIVPDGFNGTELTFKVSDDGSVYYNYRNVDNLKVAITCTANNAYGVAADDLFSIRYLKIISSVAETADRTLKLICRGI